MIFQTKEAKCIIKVLSMLAHKKSKYNEMFRETKVSHTTLQGALKELESKKLIKRDDIGHMKVDYLITDKGKKLLNKLNEIKTLVE